MRKQKAIGLFGRCLLGGALALGIGSGGCIDDYASKDLGAAIIASGGLDSPENTPQQNLVIHSAGVGMQNYQRNQAIREAGTHDKVDDFIYNSKKEKLKRFIEDF